MVWETLRARQGDGQGFVKLMNMSSYPEVPWPTQEFYRLETSHNRNSIVRRVPAWPMLLRVGESAYALESHRFHAQSGCIREAID